MDPELKRQLEEMHALTKDTHQMVRAMRRSQRLSFLLTVVFWIFVFVAPLYFYQQYVQPMIAKFSATAGVITSGPFGLPTFAELQKLLNSPKVGQ